MKKISLFTFLGFMLYAATAQQLSITDGWKFKMGDDTAQWKKPGFDDAGWQPIDLKDNWNKLGYQDHVGFGWYRKWFVLPASIKEKSFLKDSIRINLSTVDDGDEVYLNGTLIGRNGGNGADIKDGGWGARTYTIAANNPVIHWDAKNVLAVRIYNSGGIGGMYGNRVNISMPSVSESISLTNSAFILSPKGQIATKIELKSLTAKKYSGTLTVKLIDPEFHTIISSKTIKGLFSNTQSFLYDVNLLPKERKSYQLNCTFIESESGDSINKIINTAYILTPAEKPTPQINAAEIYGARPSHEFLYKIPATGRQPLIYKVKGLPSGLQVNAKTGTITGTATTKGDYNIQLIVSNSLGTATKKMVIKIGDRIGFTPTLGWNSWNAWGLSVSDEKVRISAKQMADKLAAHGWAYINIDDGWEAPQRAVNGEIVTNKKFPDMHALGNYVHGLGLKLGIYSSPGNYTCGGYLGSLGHELQDAQMYGKWGIDYLKYDWCSYGDVAGKNPSLDALKKPYFKMNDSLKSAGRDIIYSLCQYGWGDVYKWGAEVGGNSWRTTGDIFDTWESMSTIGFAQAKSYPYATGLGFVDPDMLIIGKVGWGPTLRNTRLTPDEQYFHISLWALLSSPLLIGCDMGQLDNFTLSLLNNDEVIAIDQDIKAIQAKQVLVTKEYQVWVKDLNSGAKAVGIFNTTNDYKTISLKWSELGVGGYTVIRDVWTQKDLGRFEPFIKVKLPPHGVKLVKIR